jgi:hypothetical protein
MPLERAKARQEKLENLLLDFGGMDVELASDMTDIMDKLLAVVSYLALNVRDCIMLLNRENPDVSAPDGELPVIASRIGAEPGKEPGAEPGAERGAETQTEPNAETQTDPEVEPGAEPGTDGLKGSDGIDK